jgi:putative ABC transport system permease protein
MSPWARLRAAWVWLTGTGAAASIAFGLLVFVSVFACLVIPRANTAVRTGSLRRVLATAPASSKAVTGSIALTSLSANASLAPARLSAFTGQLASQLSARGVPLASEPPAWSTVSTGSTPVTGAAAAAGGSLAQLQMMYRSALTSYSRLVAGHLPAGVAQAGGQHIVQAAVTTATAARFGLRIGSTLGFGRSVRLTVTGIIRPQHLASSFWAEARGAAAPTTGQSSLSGATYWVGTVFVGPGALQPMESLLNPEYTQVTWGFPVAVGHLGANQASTLQTTLDSVTSSGVLIRGGSGPATVTIASQLPAVLTPFTTADSAVAPLLGLLYVSLAITGAVVVLLGAWLVAEHRDAEFALRRARGATLRQLGRLALRGSAVIAVVAVVAAAALAIGLTPGSGSQLSFWLAVVTVVVTLAGPVLIAAIRHRVPGPGTVRAVRPSRHSSGVRRIVLETALLVVAIGGLVVLRAQGLSAGGANFYSSAAPVLVAVPAAIIVLRGYPAVARQLARVAGRSRGVVAFVGLTRATRASSAAAIPAFALVLALTVVTFAAMVNAAVSAGQVAASWRRVGADAIIAAPPGGLITPALQHRIAAVPGVTRTATAEVDQALLATGSELTVVFVPPAAYAAVVDQAPGPRFPLAALSRSAPSGGIPAAATPAAAALIGTGQAQFSLIGAPAKDLIMGLAGRISRVPGVSGSPVVVLPRQKPDPSRHGPGMLLVGGPHLDGARLTAVATRALPGATVTARAAVLGALAGAPVARAASDTLAQVAATAAGFGVLVLLLSLVLAARTRDMTLARMATMGLGRGQAQLLLAVEALPEVLAAAIGGIACAWALAPLVGPSIDLSVFTGPGPSTAVAADPVALVVSAAGLILAALLALAAQAALSYRRGSAGALRIIE